MIKRREKPRRSVGWKADGNVYWLKPKRESNEAKNAMQRRRGESCRGNVLLHCAEEKLEIYFGTLIITMDRKCERGNYYYEGGPFFRPNENVTWPLLCWWCYSNLFKTQIIIRRRRWMPSFRCIRMMTACKVRGKIGWFFVIICNNKFFHQLLINFDSWFWGFIIFCTVREMRLSMPKISWF
jgi:hypothetical protein